MKFPKLRTYWMLGLIMALLISVQGFVAYADDDRHEGTSSYHQKDKKKHDHEDDEDDEDEEKADHDVVAEKPSLTKPAFQDGQAATLFTTDHRFVQIVMAVRDGKYLVPADEVLQLLNIPYVEYENKTLLEAYINRHDIVVHIDTPIFYVDGTQQLSSVSPILVNQKYYLPLDSLLNILGATVELEPKNNTLTIKGA
jgi:hypothetical protein